MMPAANAPGFTLHDEDREKVTADHSDDDDHAVQQKGYQTRCQHAGRDQAPHRVDTQRPATAEISSRIVREPRCAHYGRGPRTRYDQDGDHRPHLGDGAECRTGTAQVRGTGLARAEDAGAGAADRYA